MNRPIVSFALIAALLLRVGSLFAITSDEIVIDDFSMAKGEQTSLHLKLSNHSLYTAFQCDIMLPDGLTVETNTQGTPLVQLSEENSSTHDLQASFVSNGALRIVVMSMSNASLKGNGVIASFNVTAASENIGTQQITIKNVRLVSFGERVELDAPETLTTVVVAERRTYITAKSVSRQYGGTNPTFQYEVQGAKLTGLPEFVCEASPASPVGTYDIIVKQGTITTPCVSFVNGTLTVTKAPLSISAGTYTKKQGEAMPDFTPTFTGFKNDETNDVLSKQPVLSCDATVASAPGEYPVVVSGAEAQNYDISYTNGKLVVVAADAVVVKATDVTRQYGDANPVFEFTTEGATLDGTPEITCEATASSSVGTYAILVKAGSIKNYNVAYVAGTLTVTKAPLTVTAQSYSREQGQENPVFEVTYNGWKNGEDESVLLQKPVVTTAATTGSPVGEYPLVVSGAEAQNYVIEYVNGLLKIEQPSAITEIPSELSSAVVYTISGKKLNTKSIKSLPQGIYIINGKKVVLK